ncbi:TetR/AcrR family transcriptional regulator [Insolitispirillum peregrinum]|uniref:Transcriptional regulator, TetR family n=1 Tax=Insolitispirillum peregrinum TaxID=80876 RepID=A0A1N7MR18_9PROT|nr:TetR/AcrR family transcriptional regulator [Insolitispirillum peregrinum]SIS88309.1 transcriptional regulator, TetR family [Insolitispirillum peregrinum]
MTETKPLTRGESRRQAMLAAATELFLEKGFEHTTLSDIVSRSKGSRSTLYEQFGNKEGLLRAMIEDVTSDIWAVIVPDESPLPFTEEALITLARRFVTAAMSPRAVAVFRILVTEGPRMPEMALFFLERGPRTIERLLAERFAEALRDRKTVGTPQQLAQVFIGGVMGVFHSYKVVGQYTDDIESKMNTHIPTAVRLFLNGIEETP